MRLDGGQPLMDPMVLHKCQVSRYLQQLSTRCSHPGGERVTQGGRRSKIKEPQLLHLTLVATHLSTGLVLAVPFPSASSRLPVPGSGGRGEPMMIGHVLKVIKGDKDEICMNFFIISILFLMTAA